jgi:hypothetical protein
MEELPARFVEYMDYPVLGVVSQHPRYTDDRFDPQQPCRYFIRSLPFAKTFSGIDETAIFQLMRTSCNWKRYGPLADEEVVLTDDNGEKHAFHFEAFHNRHATLGLFVYRRAVETKVIVPAASVVAAK